MAIKIQLFGQFSITYGDQSISEGDNRSKKLWKLMQYVLVNRSRPISQDELVEVLWGEGSVGDNPTASLKALLHRVRNTLEQLGFSDSRKAILRRSGAYYWNPQLPCIIDTDEFEIAAADMEKTADSEEKLDYALKTMALYKGHFLGNKYNEPWAKVPCEHYRAIYLNCYENAIRILTAERQFDEIILLSEHALEIDPEQEAFYYSLISALIAKGNYERALEAYENVLDLFYNTYRKTPSDKLRSLYRSIVKSANSIELDIAIIQERLKNECTSSPIYCEYDTFKLLYGLKQTDARSFSKPAFLILLTLGGVGSEKAPSDKHLDRAFKQLEGLLASTLSQGDVYTRYSLMQYLAVVHMANEDALFDFLKRLQQDFNSNNPALPVELGVKADLVN